MNAPAPPAEIAERPPARIGEGVDRLEDDRLLRGEGAFVDDHRRPGELHAVVLRSAVAHGRLRGIDAARARAMPGVRAVITHHEVAARCGARVPVIPMILDPLPEADDWLQPVIAHGLVRYVGEPLAVVVADSAALAEDALEAIEVDIEPLPCAVDAGLDAADRLNVVDAAGARAPGHTEGLPPADADRTPPRNGVVRVTTLRAERGDATRAFASAARVCRARLRIHRHFASPLETRGLLAWHDLERDRLVVWGAAKMPFANRRILAAQLGRDEASIDLLEGDTGGAFGLRGEFYPEDFLVPFVALLCERPVKWVEDRREHLIASNHAREAECELEIACSAEGRLLALRGRVAVDLGAYVRTTGLAQARNVIQVAPGPYRIEHVDLACDVLLSHKTPAGPYRGPGRFEADFFRERLIDLVASELGLDRVRVREANLLRASDMPWALPTLQPWGSETATDSGDCGETLARCLAEFDWSARSALSGRRIDGRWRGSAVGCYLEGGGAGPRETARLSLLPDGRVGVAVGSSLVGQGLETAMAQIAADALSLPLSRVCVLEHGSTTAVPEGFGSYSSRSTVMGGSAVLAAALEFRARLLAAAADLLDCPAHALALAAGGDVRAPDGRGLALAAIARHATGAPIEAIGRFDSSRRTYSYGAHAAHVAVDPRTGAVEVLDYVAVEDVGRIINPRLLHGQALGAIAQGLGGVFLERLAYDAHGQLLAGSLADYLLPSATCFPAIRVYLMESHPSPLNPLGAKGAGEGGIIPVGGVIANAVADALRPLGASPRSLPLSPDVVWALARAPGVAPDGPG